jgi:hypothetical protein
MLTAFAYARSPSAPLGDVFFTVSVGFFQRGISAMMTFLGLGFGVSIFVLSGSLVILPPCSRDNQMLKFYYAGVDDRWRTKLSDYPMHPFPVGFDKLDDVRAN